MNTMFNIPLTEQIQRLTEQDLIRLRLFIDELLRSQQIRTPVHTVRKTTAAPSGRFLADLKPIGIPGSKAPFNRSMIYDDLAV